MRPATPKAATIGTARMRGVPKIPEKTSDKTEVGSSVAADTSNEEEEDKTVVAGTVVEGDANDSPKRSMDDDSMNNVVFGLVDGIEASG